MLRFTFFYPLTYEHVGKIQKKEKKTNIYTSQTHTQLHTDKKERKKTHPSTFFCTVLLVLQTVFTVFLITKFLTTETLSKNTLADKR